jgi:hypothetical protein
MNAFLDITSVTKNRVTDYDVTVLDVDENVLSVIANNTIAANYQVVDVSSCPWLAQSGSDKDHYLEVLYKKALPYLSNDGDEFPAVGYDYAIVNKMLQLWYQEQGQVEKALAYDQLVTRTLARKHEDENRATEDCVALVENPHDTIQPRIRTSRPLRYSGTGYGRFLR